MKSGVNSHKDHPRRCGENIVRFAVNGDFMGSPPQVRGKRVDTQDSAQAIGITPAGAGKTDAACFFSDKLQDHPRRCGENEIPNGSTFITDGSPPQVRGKLRKMHEKFGQDRITPAGAGKTASGELKRVIPADHPRRCGENPPDRRETHRRKGSPPQVRGKHTVPNK